MTVDITKIIGGDAVAGAGGDGTVWLRGTDGIWSLLYTDDDGNTTSAIQGFANGNIIHMCGSDYVHRAAEVWSETAAGEAVGAQMSSMTRVYDDGATWGFEASRWFRWTGAAWVKGDMPGDATSGQCFGVSALEAWACGGSGGAEHIYHTTDGGANWTDLYSQVVADIGESFSIPTGCWGRSANEVYFVCEGDSFSGAWGGHLVKWDGAAFSIIASGMMNDGNLPFWGPIPYGAGARICGTATMLWIIAGGGSRGNFGIFRWDGSTLTKQYDRLYSVTPSWAAGVKAAACVPDGLVITFVLLDGDSNADGLESTDGGSTWHDPDASWPFHAWGCSLSFLTNSGGVTGAFASGIRVVRVTLITGEVLEGDPLDPNKWSVQRLDTGQNLTVLSVAATDDPTIFEVAVLEKFGHESVSYCIKASGLFPSDAGVTFAGLRAVEDQQDQVMVQRRAALRDIANPPLPSDTLVGGTLLIIGGDYATEEGVQLLSKLILRRLLTKPGEFSHLPDYGIGLSVKEPLPLGALSRLEREINDQVSKEPEVAAAETKVLLDAENHIVVIKIRVRVKTTGQEVNMQYRNTSGTLALAT